MTTVIIITIIIAITSVIVPIVISVVIGQSRTRFRTGAQSYQEQAH
jgi:hypothetical protein